ncbi:MULTISPECIES: class I lanthipeptide [unclassified Flavobacterium]|uniref:class I lanthipeptide n=1 Tax=unclassified Flavobacterium TaxID=196869 RepID=UPI001AD5B258|nr:MULTISPECIES: class I lanthipeptide [unclassified Flavobacterium]MBN9283332.1 class I lanthipeptide [Flavobacterium sp.]
MKKQTANKPDFHKNTLVELNEGTMSAIAGGTSLLSVIVVTGTSLIATIGLDMIEHTAE